MDGARAVFLASGFDGASMNDIARSAGVSKGTLYAYFGSKEDLFKAIIREQNGADGRAPVHVSARGRRRATCSTEFGVRLMRRMTDPGLLALAPRRHRARRKNFPTSAAPSTRPARCTARPGSPRSLRRFEKAGALKVPDPERAAWQFIDLCQSYVYKRVLFGVVERADPEEIEATVVAAVDVFMKAYGA